MLAALGAVAAAAAVAAAGLVLAAAVSGRLRLLGVGVLVAAVGAAAAVLLAPLAAVGAAMAAVAVLLLAAAVAAASVMLRLLLLNVGMAGLVAVAVVAAGDFEPNSKTWRSGGQDSAAACAGAARVAPEVASACAFPLAAVATGDNRGPPWVLEPKSKTWRIGGQDPFNPCAGAAGVALGVAFGRALPCVAIAAGDDWGSSQVV